MSASQEQLPDTTRFWWVLVGVGVLSVAAGIIVLAKPDDSLATLAVIAGIFVLADGVAELVMSLSQRTANRGLVALLGTLNLIVGVLLIRHPIGGVTAIALFIGIWLIAAGAIRFVAAFESEHRTSRLLVAGVEIVAGIVIVASPNIGFATLALLVGLSFIFNGAGMILVGMAMHAGKENVSRPGPRTAAA